jgi:hypothetical protein
MRLSSIVAFLSQLVVISLICAMLYLTVQQCYRMGANDPQLQISSNICDRLSRGQPAGNLFNGDSLDIARTQSTFGVLFDPSGQPIQSTGLLNGKMPHLPSGVFAFTKDKGEDRISWQPERGVRIAMVIQQVSAPGIGFVGIGRSLKDVEERIQNLGWMVLICWLISIGVVIVNAIFQLKKNNKRAE